MRCSRCGNDNPETNRFCGTCGASLLTAPAPPVAARKENISQASPVRVPAAQMPAPPRAAAPTTEEVPAISGPSFLGLNAPASSSSDHGSNFGRDSYSSSSHPSRTSRNLDYLLEDEEESKGGAGKIFLILIALVLAAGFGYLRRRSRIPSPGLPRPPRILLLARVSLRRRRHQPGPPNQRLHRPQIPHRLHQRRILQTRPAPARRPQLPEARR